MNLLEMIRKLEEESKELKMLAFKCPFEKSAEIRKKQDIKWKQLQTLKKMVNKNGIN